MFRNPRTEKIMRMVSNSKVSDTGQEFVASQTDTTVETCDSYIINLQGIPEKISATEQVEEFAVSQIDTPVKACDSYINDLQGIPEEISATEQVEEFAASQIDTSVNIFDTYVIELQGFPEKKSEIVQVQEFRASQINTPVIPSGSSACDSYIELRGIPEVVDFTDLTILNTTDNIDLNMDVAVEVLDSEQQNISSGMIDEAFHNVSLENDIEGTSQDATIDHTENLKEEYEKKVKKRNKKPVPKSIRNPKSTLIELL